MRDRLRGHPIIQLALARVREVVREPSVLFWVFGFPILLTIALGLAFRGQNVGKVAVDVVGEDVAGTVALLEKAGIRARATDASEARLDLRSGRAAMILLPGTAGSPDTYRYDPKRPEAPLARALVDDALETARGRRTASAARDELVTEPGARYVDFLVPGLMGMNLMSGSMWGIGYVIVDLRVRRVLKRLLATPMRRHHLFLGHGLARLVFVFFEVTPILLFGRLAFGIALNGSLLSLALLSLLGSASFAGLGVLVASRARNTETVSGLMNLVMMPMFVCSGVFFAASHFPDAVQPLLRLLPLTALNDALRAVMIDGAPLTRVLREIAVMVGWGIGSLLVGVRLFRWT